MGGPRETGGSRPTLLHSKQPVRWGRCGRAQHASEAFAPGSYLGQLGVQSREFGHQQVPEVAVTSRASFGCHGYDCRRRARRQPSSIGLRSSTENP